MVKLVSKTSIPPKPEVARAAAERLCFFPDCSRRVRALIGRAATGASRSEAGRTNANETGTKALFQILDVMATDAAARRAVRVLALLLLAIATPRAAVASDATDLYYPEDGPVRALADADFDALVAENGREA